MVTVLELQKKFSLFKRGDRRQGIIVSEVNNELQIKMQGGALGFIKAESLDFYKRNGLVLTPGKTLEFEIAEIKDGIPYLFLPAEYVFSNSYQKARVRFSGTLGVVVEFDWDNAQNIGLYNPPIKMDEDLSKLEENTRVLCKGLTKMQDYYQIETLIVDDSADDEIATTEEADEDEDVSSPEFEMPEAWTDEETRQYVAENGGLMSKGAYRVGICYLATVIHGNLISFADSSKASIKKKEDPTEIQIDDDIVVVRMLKISDYGDFKEVALIKVVDAKYAKAFKKHQNKNYLPENITDLKLKQRHSYIDSGYVFGERDESIFQEGKKSGSELNFEKYWLGFLYVAGIENENIVLKDNQGQAINLVILENPDYGALSDENVAFVRIHYIKRVQNKVTLTVQIEFVRQRKPGEMF